MNTEVSVKGPVTFELLKVVCSAGQLVPTGGGPNRISMVDYIVRWVNRLSLFSQVGMQKVTASWARWLPAEPPGQVIP